METPTVRAKQSSSVAMVPVVRTGGKKGSADVSWFVDSSPLIGGADYSQLEGTVSVGEIISHLFLIKKKLGDFHLS